MGPPLQHPPAPTRRTKSARDLSYLYLGVYSLGLLFIVLYLWFEKALVGFVCEIIELVS